MKEFEPYTEYERIHRSINASKLIHSNPISRWIDLFEQRYGVPEMANLLRQFLSNRFL